LCRIDTHLVHLGFLSTSWNPTPGREPHGVVGWFAGPEYGGRWCGDSGRLRHCLEPGQRPVIGDDDLVGQQAVQLQQQGVGVVLVIRAQGRAQFLDLLLDEAKLLDDGALACASMAFRIAVTVIIDGFLSLLETGMGMPMPTGGREKANAGRHAGFDRARLPRGSIGTHGWDRSERRTHR
jgi:hypothetical protein